MPDVNRPCGHCDSGTMRPSILPLYRAELEHDGRKYSVEVEDFHVEKCDHCETMTADSDEEDRLSDALRDAVGLLRPDQIRDHRKALGLTQQELADAIGISPSTLSRWEKGGQIQQRCMDKSLRVFFAFPEVRAALGSSAMVWQLVGGS